MVGKMRYTFASSGSPVEESVDYKKERKIHVLYLIYKIQYTKQNSEERKGQTMKGNVKSYIL